MQAEQVQAATPPSVPVSSETEPKPAVTEPAVTEPSETEPEPVVTQTESAVDNSTVPRPRLVAPNDSDEEVQKPSPICTPNAEKIKAKELTLEKSSEKAVEPPENTDNLSTQTPIVHNERQSKKKCNSISKICTVQ